MTPDAVPASARRRVDFTRRATGRPTMESVASLAGVSLKTVSRVVNGEEAVRPATAEKVRTALQELGYRRNDAAAALARAQTQAEIGLLIEDVSDTFYSRLLSGVQEVARSNRHLVMLSSSEEDSDLERTAVQALVARGVAGLIVIPHSTDQSYLADAVDAGLSVVFVDRPPRNLSADCVLSDNEHGAQEAVAHLTGRGHRRVGFVGNGPAVYTSRRRLAGYRSALSAADLPVDESLVVLGPRTEQAAAEAVRGLLESPEPPTAIFTQNNVLTLGAWRAIRDSGRTVELVGFDDFGVADLLEPPVSVVAQDPVGLGRRAAELLFERLAGAADAPRRVVVPTRFVVR